MVWRDLSSCPEYYYEIWGGHCRGTNELLGTVSGRHGTATLDAATLYARECISDGFYAYIKDVYNGNIIEIPD